MHVERQGNSECMLATIAAIAMRPLAEVRAIACKHAGVRKWSRARSYKFWDAVDYTARSVGGDALAALVAPSTPRERVSGVESQAATWNATKELPAQGRGIVRFYRTHSPRASGHIAPWQDGLIYDPAMPDPKHGLFLSHYLKLCPGFSVKDIRSIAFEGNPEDCISPSPDMGY